MSEVKRKYTILPGVRTPDFNEILEATSDYSEPGDLSFKPVASNTESNKRSYGSSPELEALKNLGEQVSAEEERAMIESQKKMNAIMNSAVLAPQSMDSLLEAASHQDIDDERREQIELERKQREEAALRQKELEMARAERRAQQNKAFNDMLASKAENPQPVPVKEEKVEADSDNDSSATTADEVASVIEETPVEVAELEAIPVEDIPLEVAEVVEAPVVEETPEEVAELEAVPVEGIPLEVAEVVEAPAVEEVVEIVETPAVEEIPEEVAEVVVEPVVEETTSEEVARVETAPVKEAPVEVAKVEVAPVVETPVVAKVETAPVEVAKVETATVVNTKEEKAPVKINEFKPKSVFSSTFTAPAKSDVSSNSNDDIDDLDAFFASLDAITLEETPIPTSIEPKPVAEEVAKESTPSINTSVESVSLIDKNDNTARVLSDEETADSFSEFL